MKPFEYYNNVGEYPKVPKKPTIGMYGLTAAGARAFADAMDEYDRLMPIYEAARKEYNNKKSSLEMEFKKDLLACFSLTNHPKANEIYEYVWDEGHAYGYSEVYNKLDGMNHLFS